MPNTPRSY